ncbi:MAG: hypothetical protein ACC662_03665, partial [Planctomycetota bacterium]
SGRSFPSFWQITRIDGVSTDRLVGVIAMRYDGKSGKLIQQVAARELEIGVDRGRQVTEFRFHDGVLNSPQGRRPFTGGVWRQIVAQGNMISLWSRSGMLFVRVR